MKQILSLFITSLALCTACSSPKGSDTVQVAETTTEQTIQKASSAIHYNAFSHNDYWRERPLLDALSFRFNCVEADLWLIDDELYVSHDRPEPNPAITFENLYLKPLVARIQANGGKVYPGSDRPFYLMVDCKAQGEEMYKLLKKQMEPYKEYFCSVDNGEYKEGAVLFFLSGDRPKNSLPKENSRFTFLDGQIKDLDQHITSPCNNLCLRMLCQKADGILYIFCFIERFDIIHIRSRPFPIKSIRLPGILQTACADSAEAH